MLCCYQPAHSAPTLSTTPGPAPVTLLQVEAMAHELPAWDRLSQMFSAQAMAQDADLESSAVLAKYREEVLCGQDVSVSQFCGLYCGLYCSHRWHLAYRSSLQHALVSAASHLPLTVASCSCRAADAHLGSN
jgi:hypothetical protein